MLTIIIKKKILLGAWLRRPLRFKAILGILMTSFSPYENTCRETEALVITQLGILYKESWGRNLKKKEEKGVPVCESSFINVGAVLTMHNA